ncbi:MAG: Hsp20/alpha crystallin family protein [Usitatibacter sp.]
MFRRTGSTDWMWAHACDLMDQAERMHRQFFRLATSSRAQAAWEPPADVFEDEREVVIVIAMPGVSAERIEVASEPGELVVRGARALPFARSRYAVRNLEIPYGHFERRIALPEGRFESVTHELSHGCLILRLRK